MSAISVSRSFVPTAMATAVGLALLLSAAVLAQETPRPEAAAPTAETSALPSAAPLEARPEGSWDVLAFDPWAEGLVEPRPDTTLTASFLPDGRLEGETGCGTYFGVYVIDAERIDMRVISKGPDPCGPKRTEEAVAFSVALDAAASWRATDTGLELLDEAGAVRLILGRADDAGLSGDWLVEGYAKPNGQLVEPLPGSSIRISFGSEGSVSGSTGCRLFEGGYESESDRVVIAPIKTVGLPCKGDERRQERRLLRVLDETVLWAGDAGGLVLGDGFENPLLVLRPAPVEGDPAPLPGASADPAEISA